MPAIRYLRDAAVFEPCYVALDWASYIDPVGPFNITPWNPQPALALAWMTIGGLAHAPAVLVTIVGADILVRGAPGGVLITLLSSLTLAAGYAALAWFLRKLLRGSTSLHTARELTQFVVVTAGGTAIVGAAFLAVLGGAALIPSTELAGAWLRFWIGDAVGVLVTAPLLFAVADPVRRAALLGLARRGETAVQAVVLVATIWLVVAVLPGDPAQHFYFLFVPLLWIAARAGMNGAVVATAIVQLGVVLGVHLTGAAALPVLELQALVATLTLTGLYLGMMVEEREQAAESLRRSLRLAAAGEMAGAITHEVNQPLTALANYGRSAQMLLEAGRNAELAGVIASMLAEAQRASEVVRRLRDLFRQGTTRLEPVPVTHLLEAARRAAPGNLRVSAEGELPDVLVDRLQIELVLRNLVANAAEAVASHAPGHGQIAVTAKRDDARHVRIVVSDNGPGISATAGKTLFEPFVSGKPTGMGLGLAVSRAIAEAHGGTLEARAASHGEFHLVLPFSSHA